ncbi:MAG: AI-2E family transporter [Oenococcus sp.]|uniref:Permease n=1 Tax=Oenococcus kitaharae DSM 17330 TaxID=1045004 RepID=G9WHZ3_9LACO|nr:AI-2E family transporter [Oenococcus kitaharae]EHN58878.1 hypothetical protein OKIT_0769 [Oenococcus kitaharae DSM 17330]MCV3296860.1 AI-2E family transporter [Oenococcus kitaharae]OEY81796.1 membrane protein [Oenococcus kitaharae]OEY84027.1 membrane protein [Oenococcus kitaharae]OEY85616.1 membrane protein [Oenococcus kitaharae]
MDDFIQFLKRKNVKLYLTLALLILVIYFLRAFMGIVLLTTIFAYLAIKSSLYFKKRFQVPYLLAVVSLYILILGLLAAAISYAAPLLVDQLKVIPQMVSKAIINHPLLNRSINRLVNRFIHSSEMVSNSRNVVVTGFREAGHVGRGLTHFVLAVFLSFVYSISRPRILSFGKEFLKSPYHEFFGNVHFLARKFVLILGKIIETQLLICTINTFLMTIGLFFLRMPDLLLLAIIVFLLGLIPVAGVLISVIPLTVIAFASGGLIRVAEVIVLVIVIHMFESYFLHPRLMADRTDLPVFIAFITLIVMSKLIGDWGLIVGLPIVSFFLDIFGIHSSEKSRKPKNNG